MFIILGSSQPELFSKPFYSDLECGREQVAVHQLLQDEDSGHLGNRPDDVWCHPQCLQPCVRSPQQNGGVHGSMHCIVLQWNLGIKDAFWPVILSFVERLSSSRR